MIHSHQSFVAGIFSDKSKCDIFNSAIPAGHKQNVNTTESDYSYPIYITEDHRGFSILSEIQAESMMFNFMQEMDNHDDEWCYTNLYKIDNDFIPLKPGQDRMGELMHWHIDNILLSQIKEKGFSSLWDEEAV